jgi:hypothetical protein
MRTRLDDGVFVVSKLWGGRVGVPFDIAGYQLRYCESAWLQQPLGIAGGRTHMSRHKESERASLGKETLWIDGVDNGINLIRVRQPLAATGADFALPSLL